MYKISEFAKLCGVKKGTLLYYDEIGILKPAVVKENGYRYYSLEQHQRYTLIATFIEAGASLKEIQDIITANDLDKTVDTIHNKIEILNDQQKKISRMKYALIDTVKNIEIYKSAKKTFPIVNFEDCDEEYMIAYETNAEGRTSEDEMLQRIRELLDYCYTKRIPTSLHVGEMILRENAINGVFQESCYFSKTPKRINDKHLLIKPAGTYAITFHRGDYNNIVDTYSYIVNYLKRHEYEICGNIYEEDVVDYILINDPEKYISKISVPVTTKQSDK
ncbi:MAG: MerR family transcriptional regulator [Anaerovoracaceae bacterium]